MTEKPILFSGPMVRAILEGRKTQTRRVVKPVPANPDSWDDISWKCVRHAAEGTIAGSLDPALFRKIRYPTGTRIWVRETYGTRPDLSHVEYRADRLDSVGALPFEHIYDERTKWRSSMFMPRKYSRINLIVTDVRCQRLQDISEEDAMAEGVDWNPDAPAATTRRSAYAGLWDRINAKRGFPWASNPWVWVYTFSRILE